MKKNAGKRAQGDKSAMRVVVDKQAASASSGARTSRKELT